VLRKCQAETPGLQPNRNCDRDWFNIGIGLVWQTSMVALPIYLVIKQWGRMWVCLAVFAVMSVILKFTWYDRLGRDDGYMNPDR
jgi:hypothetical protein